MKPLNAPHKIEETNSFIGNSPYVITKRTRVVLRYLFVIVLFSWSSTAIAKEPEFLDYEIVCAGNSEGHYLVEVSVFVSKKKEINEETVKRCALHGVLFKGFSAKEPGCVSQRRMIDELKDSDSEFIKDLLSKDYGQYTETIGIPLQVVKQAKLYRVTTTVQVAKNQLRRDLEKAGVIRKLGL